MPNCRKCNSPTIWKQPYKQGDLPVNPNGSRHSCGGTLAQEREVYMKKWHATEKFKVPIYCYDCEKSHIYTDVCQWMRDQGFVEGVDTCEFWSDKWSAIKKREMLKAHRKKEVKKNEYDPRVTKPL